MARAGRVKGIKPKKSLGMNAEKVVALRLEEFLSWRDALHDPSRVTELHNMRIAAKRLRYALEMFDICYPDAKGTLKILTDIQEDLGTLHDLDVLVEVLHGRLQPLDAAVDERATEIMRVDTTPQEKNVEVRRLLGAAARDPRRIGLVGLIGDKVVERRRRFAGFTARWSDEALDAFATEVQVVTNLQATVPQPPEDGLPAPVGTVLELSPAAAMPDSQAEPLSP